MTYRVVIVDDEPWARAVVKSLGEWDKFDLKIVAEASGGKEALRLIEQYQAHIVITDMRMPGLDGVDLLATLSEQFPRLKIIVMSGYDDFSYLRQAIRSQAVEYLLKPIDPVELQHCLDKCVKDLANQRLLDSYTLTAFATLADQEQYLGYRQRVSQHLLELNRPAVLRTLEKLEVFLQEALSNQPKNSALATIHRDLALILVEVGAEMGLEYGLQDNLNSSLDSCYTITHLIRDLMALYTAQIEVLNKLLAKDEQLDIDKVVQHLAKHFSEPTSLEAVADLFHVTKEHLSRKFKEITGENMSSYITKKRMEKARQLLNETELPIKEIAEITGYLDIPYFHRVFKKYYGSTPGSLRNK